MAVIGRRVTVGTSPVRLDSDASDRAMGKVIHLRNAGITAVSLGPSTVTAAGGYALDASASLTVPLDDLSPLYAVAASGMVTVHVLEVGV